MKSKNPYFAKSQQGIATVLTVALVGIALIVSITGTAYYLRTKQYSAASNHALTQAQADVWSGVEIVQQYLNTRSASQLDTLMTDGIPAITNLPPNIAITAKIDSVNKSTTESGLYTVTSTITSRNTISKSASTVQVVYEVKLGGSAENTNPPSGGSNTLTNAMNFYGDLDASGGIKLSDAGDRAVINVGGNFNTSSGLEGIKELNVIGNVTMSGWGSGAGLKRIISNGNVDLSGSAQSEIVSAKGTITTSGGGNSGDLYADKEIYLGTNAKSANTLSFIKTTNWITVSNYLKAGQGKLDGKDIGIYISGGGNIKNVSAKGDVDIRNNINNADEYISEKLMNCTNNWSAKKPLKAFSFDGNCNNNRIILTKNSNVVTPTGAIATVSLTNKPEINAYNYENQANYIFDRDNKGITVKLKNFNDIDTNKVYRLAKYKQNGKDYWGGICELPSNNICNDPVAKISTNPSNEREPIQYDSSSKQWILSDNLRTSSKLPPDNPSVAPSVMLFIGDLQLGQGNYINTLLATGNITFEGSNTSLFAPNYTNANKVCNTSLYKIPTNLCNSSSSLIPASIGNIALLSGSCASQNITSGSFCTPDQYIGGNIITKGTALIQGNIIAGNKLITGGTSNFVGSILAAALGKVSQSSLLGGTNVDFNGISDEKTTIDIPTKDDSNSNNDGNLPPTTTIKWVRYL
ncbi:hypothetical protein [Acinetobacter radioresistens]|uniref:hypothetical protein n=1 Tax=Acinetobacter radioresistens TaxID=40216 RepID=UPI0012509805|nr:hypothetical protein [Acinetobacter radioresistens]